MRLGRVRGGGGALAGLALAVLASGAAAGPIAGARIDQGLVFLEARVNGRPGVFLLDTGAGASLVDPGFAQAAGVPLSGARDIDALGGAVAARQASSVRIRLAGGPELDVRPLSADLSGPSRAMGVPLAGLIGADALRGLVLRVDYRDGTVFLGPEDGPPPPGAALVDLRMTPYVRAQARIGEAQVEGVFGLDTGSNTPVAFARGFARRALDRAAGEASQSVGLGGSAPERRGRVDALDVAGLSLAGAEAALDDPAAAPADAPPGYAGQIGGAAWRGRVLVIDFPARRAWTE